MTKWALAQSLPAVLSNKYVPLPHINSSRCFNIISLRHPAFNKRPGRRPRSLTPKAGPAQAYQIDYFRYIFCIKNFCNKSTHFLVSVAVTGGSASTTSVFLFFIQFPLPLFNNIFLLQVHKRLHYY